VIGGDGGGDEGNGGVGLEGRGKGSLMGGPEWDGGGRVRGGRGGEPSSRLLTL
jgi:hypothetical protein